MLSKPLSLFFATVLLTAAASRAADFKDLLGRIPGEANVLVILDLDKILKSPLATREGWQAKMADAYANNALLVPPGTTRMVMAALLDPIDMQSDWEVSIMEVGQPPNLESIAKAESGFVETVGDKPAAWSPIGAYFIQLDAKILGAVAPANRQFAARWARKKQTLGGAFASQYLWNAAGAAEAGAAFVLALDLEDVPSPRKIQARLQSEPFEALNGKNIDQKALVQLLASLKGITLRVDIGAEASGKCVVDFGQDAALLADCGKALFVEALGRFGAQLDDLKNWKATAQGKTLVLEGKLSPNGLRRLFSVIDPPAPLPTGDGGQPAANAGAKGDAVQAAASQQYYKAITAILDNLEKEIGSGSKSASMAQSGAWMRRDAKRIGRLPVLNVDPDLLNWGLTVNTRLNEAAQVFAVSGHQTQARTAGIQHADSYTSDWDSNADSANAINRLNRDNQRRQAAMEEKGKAVEAVNGIMQDLNGSRAKIRAAMTDRYKVEF